MGQRLMAFGFGARFDVPPPALHWVPATLAAPGAPFAAEVAAASFGFVRGAWGWATLPAPGAPFAAVYARLQKNLQKSAFPLIPGTLSVSPSVNLQGYGQ